MNGYANPVDAANGTGSKQTAERIVEYYSDRNELGAVEFWTDVVRILADREMPNEDAKPRPSRPLEPGSRVVVGKADYRGEHGRVMGISGIRVTVRLDSGAIDNFVPLDLWDEAEGQNPFPEEGP